MRGLVRVIKIFLLIAVLFQSKTAFAFNSRSLTIFAEPNMVLALTKIARVYSQKANVAVSVNFDTSEDLINEVDSGEPGDVLISANSALVEVMRQKGLIDVYNVGYVAQDELVLVTAKNNPDVPTELWGNKISLEKALEILNQKKAILMLDNENSSSGKISSDFVKKFSFEEIKIFNKLYEDRTPVLTLAKDSPDHYALLLASQLKGRKDFEILATNKNSNIFYQALVIAGDNMEIAREFLKFLKSTTAKKILSENGFIVN